MHSHRTRVYSLLEAKMDEENKRFIVQFCCCLSGKSDHKNMYASHQRQEVKDCRSNWFVQLKLARRPPSSFSCITTTTTTSCPYSTFFKSSSNTSSFTSFSYFSSSSSSSASFFYDSASFSTSPLPSSSSTPLSTLLSPPPPPPLPPSPPATLSLLPSAPPRPPAPPNPRLPFLPSSSSYYSFWCYSVVIFIVCRLSGLMPFSGDDDHQTLVKVAKADWDFDDECFDDLSHDAMEFIEGLLVKEPR